jgi:hypothetical protein
VLSEGDEEFTVDITTPAREKQKFIAKDVKEVKHSKRIAEICVGYKDRDAIDKSLKKEKEMENGKNKGKNKNLNNAFSTEIIDSDAPLPPELPISTVQTIGIE